MLIKSFKFKKIHILYFSFIAVLIITSIIHYSVLSASENTQEKKYIKWIDFSPKYNVLVDTSTLDIYSHLNNDEIKLNWIELLSYLACKYGGNFNLYKKADLNNLVEKLKSGNTISELTKNLNNYQYYYESYSAILSEFIGEYEFQDVKRISKKIWNKSVLPYCEKLQF